ncbi:MAG: acyl-CoA thioesterase II [Hyphomicrobiaceae bacterium]
MTSSSTPPTSATPDKPLVDILDLKEIGENVFRGPKGEAGWQRVYGGQVLGQALAAGAKTVDASRCAHSLHSYFLLAGDPDQPIDYEVELTRDGGSFTTRRVKAKQHGRTIFTMSCSFHAPEDGLTHQFEMPKVPPPEQLLSAGDIASKHFKSVSKAMSTYWQKPRPIELRPVEVERYFGKGDKKPIQHTWLKTTAKLPDDVAIHQAVLAYASDFTLLDTALVPHGKRLFDPDLLMASLDHAVWFHRPFRADEWLLYAQDSPSAQSGRGFCRGSLYTQDGQLIASTAQEGLMRLRRK